MFVSYSRRDSDFVRELHAHLTAEGRDVWVDWEDIPAASDWAQDIDDSIDAAESFVFVVSPSSLASEYCAGEFRHAQERGKRIVPIAIDGADPAAAPEGLRQLNWIWCREPDDREAAFAKLSDALDTDLVWARAHTRLVVRAVEWESRGDASLLLRGKDLEQAEDDLAANAGKEPTPTELQQRYVHASRRGASKRQRIVLGSVLFALAVSVALGLVALLQRNEANERARIARSQAFAAQSAEALSRAPATSLARGVAAFETSPTPQARVALRRAILANPIETVIPAAGEGAPQGDGPVELEFGGNGTRLLGHTPDGVLHLWRSEDGRSLARYPKADGGRLAPDGRVLVAAGGTVGLARPGRPPSGVRRLRAGERAVGLGFAGATPLALLVRGGAGRVLDVTTGSSVALGSARVGATDAVFSGNGRRVVTLAGEGAARVWDVRSGRLLARLAAASAAAVSPDGRLVATIGSGGGALWAVDGRRRLADLGEAAGVAFSDDGRLVAAVGGSGDATVRESSSGRPVATLPGFGTLAEGRGVWTSAFDPAVAFSPDGRLVAVANPDGIVRVWELATRRQVAAAAAGWANALAFAPNGGRLASMTWRGDVAIAAAPASVALRTGFRRSSCVGDFPPAFDPDGRRVVAPAAGGAGIWSVDGRLERVLGPPMRPAGSGSAGAAAFSGDGKTAAAAATNPQCVNYPSSRYGTIVERAGGGSPPRRVWATGNLALDPDGSLVVIGRKAWRPTTGAPVPALDGILALDPDGRLAVVSRGGTSSIVRVPSGETVVELAGAGRLGEFSSAVLGPGGDRALVDRDGVLRLWDGASGGPVARLGGAGEIARHIALGDDGRLALVVFEERAATFDAATGRPVAAVEGSFDSISSDGALAAGPRDDGTVEVVDLRTGLAVRVQTGTGRPLASASFGPSADRIVAGDDLGDVHVLGCEVCAPDDDLLALAHAKLALLAGFRPEKPPVAGVA